MRTIAIGEIHGCLKALDRLVKRIVPTQVDTIVFLGDYIDRGPESRGVVERVLALGAAIGDVSGEGSGRGKRSAKVSVVANGRRPAMTQGEHLVPGISISSSGQATVDPSLADVLFDLALKLEEPTNHPVDVQHVLAAVILAARSGELDSGMKLSSNDQALVAVLTPHVKTVFAKYGGEVGRED